MSEPLKNWKSILGFAAICVLSICWKMQWIDTNTYTWLMTFIGPVTGVALRRGMGERK